MLRYPLSLILALTLVMGGCVHAQTTAVITDRALGVNPISPGTNGVPSPVFLSYAWVRVCTMPASGSPCTPVASITDPLGNALSIVGGNFGQLQTDVVGRFNFGCTPGNYQVQVAPAGSNTPQLTYYLTCPANSGLLSSPNTWTSTQTFANVVISGTLTANGAATFTAGLVTNTLTVSGGGSLAGTFSGNPTFSGIVTFSQNPVLPSPLTLPLVNNYNSTAIVGVGFPSVISQADATAQTAAYNVNSPNVPATGMYRVTFYEVETRAATTSSSLGNVSISSTDPETGNNPACNLGTNTANLLGSTVQGVCVVRASSGNFISIASGYASSGATTMQYSVHWKIEKMD